MCPEGAFVEFLTAKFQFFQSSKNNCRGDFGLELDASGAAEEEEVRELEMVVEVTAAPSVRDDGRGLPRRVDMSGAAREIGF